MTTIVADIINASVLGNPVTITDFEYDDPVTTSKNLVFTVDGNIMTNLNINTAATANRTITFPNPAPLNALVPLLTRNDIISTNKQFDILKLTTGFVFTSLAILGKKDATVTVPTNIIKVPNRSITLVPQNNLSTTILKSTAPAGSPANVIFPNVSSTLLTGGVTNIFLAQTTCSAPIKTPSIIANTTNSNLTLSANGSGNVIVTNLSVDSIITNTTNSDLQISSNGTGLPTIGFNGFTFSNEALKFYKSSSFQTSFICGSFNSGNVTFQFERIGNRVMIRVPIVNGTPNIDLTFATPANSLPVELRPLSNVIVIGGVGIRNSSTKAPIYVTIFLQVL